MLITVDFDGTLRLYTGEPNEQMINTIRLHETVGDEIVIVTRRKYNDLHAGIWGPEVTDWVKDYIGPYEVVFTEGEMKWSTIASLSPKFHYDDDSEECELISKYTDTTPVLVEPTKMIGA